MNREPAYELFYDERCRLCRATARTVLRLAPAGTILPVGLRSDRAREALSEESEDERLGSFHLLAPDGRRWKGADAIPPLLERLPRARRLGRVIRRSRVASDATARAYGWVTRNRGWLGRFIPERWSRPVDTGDARGPSLS